MVLAHGVASSFTHQELSMLGTSTDGSGLEDIHELPLKSNGLDVDSGSGNRRSGEDEIHPSRHSRARPGKSRIGGKLVEERTQERSHATEDRDIDFEDGHQGLDILLKDLTGDGRNHNPRTVVDENNNETANPGTVIEEPRQAAGQNHEPDDDEDVNREKEVILDEKAAHGGLEFVRQWFTNRKEGFKQLLGVDEFDHYHYIIAFAVLVSVVLVMIFPFTLTVMRDTEIGVGYSSIATRFQNNIIQSGGVRSKLWGGKVVRWPRTEQILDYTSSDNVDVVLDDSNPQNIRYFPHLTCNSKDGLLIELYFDVHLKIKEGDVKYLTKNYRSFENWFDMVAVQVKSSIYNSCQTMNATDFQSKRGEGAQIFEDDLRFDVKRRFRGDVVRMNLKDTHRPVAFENAINDKESARSTVQLAKNEEEQGLIKGFSTVDIANQEVIRVLNTANLTAFITYEQGIRTAEATAHKLDQVLQYLLDVKIRNNFGVNSTLAYIESETLTADMTIAVDLPSQVSFWDEL